MTPHLVVVLPDRFAVVTVISYDIKNEWFLCEDGITVPLIDYQGRRAIVSVMP